MKGTGLLHRFTAGGRLPALLLALALMRPAGAQMPAEAEPSAAEPEVIAGVTFAGESGTLYAPVREVGERLGLPVRWDAGSAAVYLEETLLPAEQLRSLPDGTQLVRLRALEEASVTVVWEGEEHGARLAREGREVWVRGGPKRVAINRDAQQMRAWQGDLLVLETRVSTGRRGMPTPTGSFTAGPLKRRMLISRKFNNAKMPWSVQIRGDYVIHGYHSVPPRAASHGCVRVPLTGFNPAKWFYEWVEVGTPILITDGWPEEMAGAPIR